jgi:hypothetical protein
MKKNLILTIITLIIVLFGINIVSAQTYVQSRLEVDGITPYIATALVFDGSSVPKSIEDYEFTEDTNLELGRASIRSTSTNTRIINNNRSVSVTLHVFIPVIAKEAGEQTIPSVRIRAVGRTFLTTPMKAEFFKTGRDSFSARIADESDKDEVIRFSLTPETNTAYPQQPLTIRADIYLSPVRNYEPNSVEMDFTFLEQIGKQNIEPLPPKQGTGDRVSLTVRDTDKNFIFRQNGSQRIGNKVYSIYSGWFNIYPVKPGELTLYSSTLRVVYAERTNSFFSSFSDSVEFTAYSETVNLNIKDFPDENRPVHFTGAVGRYSIRAIVDNTIVRVGEPIILELVVSGEGILENIQRPDLNLIDEFNRNFKISRESTPGEIMGNSIHFQYTIRPISDEIEAIPSIPFSYFNVDKGAYETTKTKPITLEVTSGKIVGEDDIVSNIDRDEISEDDRQELTTTEGILSNYNQPDALRDHRVNLLYFLLILVIPAGYIITYILVKKHRILEEDVSAKRFKIAKRKFEQYISRAKANLENDNFYQLLAEGLMGYISDKFNLGRGEITSADLEEIFTSHGLTQANLDGVLSELKDVFNKCEMGRFNKIGTIDKQGREHLLEKTRHAINTIESIQKKR